jgi:hypothetical protein
MPLPAGVTLIPRKTVSKVANDFQLIGRNSNSTAGDSSFNGNAYNAFTKKLNQCATNLETIRTAGNLSATVVGNDIRAWVQVTDDQSSGNSRASARPGSIMFWGTALAADKDFITQADASLSGFQPGDRITFVNLSVRRIDIYFSGTGTFTGPGGSGLNRLRLKAANVGVSATLERCYIDATAKTLGWRLVSTSAVVGTLVDANPIGVQ